jgi:O-antigen ligase
VTVTVAAVALSIVRGAWVAVAFGALTIPFILRPERWRLWAGTLAALVAVGFATGLIPLVIHMVSGLSESSLLDRRILFAEGLRVMLAHPLTGVGILNFGWYSPSIERHPVHNAFIQVGSELGIPALLLYVALFAYVGVRLIRAMRSTPDRAVRAGLGSVLAGLIGLTFIVQGEPMAYSQFVWIFLALGEAASRVVLAGGV